MIDRGKLKLAAKFVDNLPIEDGTVTRSDRKISDTEVQRVWAVEYSGQTILLEFVFDDTEERERTFAELLACGTGLILFLANKYSETEAEISDVLHAFEVVFNSTMKQYREAVGMIPYDIESDDDIPTVGESNG